MLQKVDPDVKIRETEIVPVIYVDQKSREGAAIISAHPFSKASLDLIAGIDVKDVQKRLEQQAENSYLVYNRDSYHGAKLYYSPEDAAEAHEEIQKSFSNLESLLSVHSDTEGMFKINGEQVKVWVDETLSGNKTLNEEYSGMITLLRQYHDLRKQYIGLRLKEQEAIYESGGGRSKAVKSLREDKKDLEDKLDNYRFRIREVLYEKGTKQTVVTVKYKDERDLDESNIEHQFYVRSLEDANAILGHVFQIPLRESIKHKRKHVFESTHSLPGFYNLDGNPFTFKLKAEKVQIAELNKPDGFSSEDVVFSGGMPLLYGDPLFNTKRFEAVEMEAEVPKAVREQVLDYMKSFATVGLGIPNATAGVKDKEGGTLKTAGWTSFIFNTGQEYKKAKLMGD